ncbi:MAG: AraC family transcriptional regulator [Acidobacteriaceae bacterium]|nr:AraC family transcriptional regulator [Acidobacteriaceae bacterium]
MQQALARKLAAHTQSEGEHPTRISALALFRHTAPGACHPAMCEPSLSIFVQGRKLINLGGTEYLCDRASFLVSSIDVPIQSQILEASEAVPFLAMRLRLDMSAVQEVLSWEDLPELEAHTAFGAGYARSEKGSPERRGLAVGETPIGLLAAATRLLELLETPEDIPFLAPLIQREIAYRVIRTPQGERLRAIATRGDLSNRTARAIAWLRANYTKPLHMEELAGVAHMGVSTLHHQFRALTAMSPLQYQKQLRLQAARQRMLTDGIDVTSAAYEVGYESVSQFSREYSRFFGQPPMRDVRTLRLAGTQAIHSQPAQYRAHSH